MPRPSVDTESSGPFKMFGRSKKPIEEPKPEVDLNAALPPSDDFRTSLLMTGLSARFSMLREQDDPSSKLGKASDDSVLFPKRQSRMDFGLGSGLHDIAEDSSFKAPQFSRMDSYQSDDAASLSGSIMNRSKPTDGNNLFGGRQKIYKISAAGGSSRALYDDDVAQSSFQRWRQTEREKQSLEYDGAPDAYDPSSLQPDSPYMQEFNRRRETSSTTSSIPSAARNSTAATSIVSQPAASFKDSSGTPSANSSVTRTRRLYEQSLNQDIQDQQTSTLSRFDTISRTRPMGNRTPDLAHNAQSPTIPSQDRVNERRPMMMSKASAPNLRSFSPPVFNSQQPSPVESTSRFPGSDNKSGLTTSPPLSPPISETEEFKSLSIAPNDRGKATALGLFSRPAQQYDDNKYAQRMRQLQQGRDTPTLRNRTDSDVSLPTSRSRSSSSVHRPSVDRSEVVVNHEPVAQKEVLSPTFLDIDEDEEEGEAASRQHPTPPVQFSSGRPHDQDHPALRRPAPPEPWASAAKMEEQKPVSQDSPTLGPGSGLSGMVKQHMRNDSNASSVYGAAPQDPDRSSYYISDGNAAASMDQLGIDSNPWGAATNPYDQSNGNVSKGTDNAFMQEPSESEDAETDEFARHLADGARRVRERLTTYVDSDHSRSTSPSGTPHVESNQELPPPRTNAFSVLRSKSSRGSLADRSRERSRSRAGRMLQVGLGAATFTSSPSPSKTEHNSQQRVETPETSPTERDENAHAGLKAFRQARRELQKMKEVEVQQRHQTAQSPPQRRQSEEQYDRSYPPVSYNRMPSGDSGSRPGSRARSERDRSGSEASSGGQPSYRPRLRAETSSYDDYHYPNSPVNSNNIQSVARAPGDARRFHGGPPHLNLSDSYPRPAGQPTMGGNPLPSAASTPGLPISPAQPGLPLSPSMPPPLPPINPRRKGMGSPSAHSEDGANGFGPGSRARTGRTLLMSDDEAGPAQYRQRLRKVTSEANGVSRGRPERAPPRPPPQTTVSSGDMTGGMI